MVHGLFLFAVCFCLALGVLFFLEWRKDFPNDSFVISLCGGLVGFFIGLLILSAFTLMGLVYLQALNH